MSIVVEPILCNWLKIQNFKYNYRKIKKNVSFSGTNPSYSFERISLESYFGKFILMSFINDHNARI